MVTRLFDLAFTFWRVSGVVVPEPLLVALEGLTAPPVALPREGVVVAYLPGVGSTTCISTASAAARH